jgi:hypothetical protein
MMFWLLLATGFTGALTLRFLFRQLVLLFVVPPSVEVRITNGADSLDNLLGELKRARQEILVLAHSFVARPVAKALVEAKLRNIKVEVLLDPACERDRMSDLAFLLEHGIGPLATAPDAISTGAVLVIDGRTIYSGGFSSPVELGEDTAVDMLCIKGYADVAAAYRQHFSNEKSSARPAEPRPQPVPAMTSRTNTTLGTPHGHHAQQRLPATPAPATPSLPTAATPAPTRQATIPATPEPSVSRSSPTPVNGGEESGVKGKTQVPKE